MAAGTEDGMAEQAPVRCHKDDIREEEEVHGGVNVVQIRRIQVSDLPYCPFQDDFVWNHLSATKQHYLRTMLCLPPNFFQVHLSFYRQPLHQNYSLGSNRHNFHQIPATLKMQIRK